MTGDFRAFWLLINIYHIIWAHRSSIKGTKLLFIVIKAIIIILQILSILLPVKMNEIEGTRTNSSSQVFARWNETVKTSRIVFKYFSSGWILTVQKHSLLKCFTLTFSRHKSFKFEGSGPPLGRFHLIIPGNQKTEFRNPTLNSWPLLPFNQLGFDRIGGAVKKNGSHQQVL